MKKYKKQRGIVFVFIFILCTVWGEMGFFVSHAGSVGKGARIICRNESGEARFHLGGMVGKSEYLDAEPTGSAVLTDIQFTSSDPQVCPITKEADCWKAERLKEGTAVITMTCKANGKEVMRTLLITSFTRAGEGGEIKGVVKNGTTVYLGCSDVEGITSDDTEIKAVLDKDTEALVMYQCENFYRVELENDSFGESGEYWGYVKKEQVEIPVTGVSAREEITVLEQHTDSLDAHIVPVIAGNPGLTYYSSNTNVATVDEKGILTGVHAGSAVVTVTSQSDSSCMAKCRVTVEPYVPVTGIQVIPDRETVEDGTSGKISVTFLPEHASIQEFSWNISAEDVLTVSSKGKYRAQKPGTATVTVTAKDGGFSDSCQIKVLPVAATGVTIQKTMSIDVGESRTPVWKMEPSNATNKGAVWNSSNTAVAVVDKRGCVTGVREGQAEIRIKTADGGYEAVCKVTVEEYVDDIELNDTFFNMTLGKTKQLKVTLSPEKPTVKKILWYSGDPKVVKVNQNGKIKALSTGRAKVTVYDRYTGAYDFCVIQVKANLSKPKLKGVQKKKKLVLSWKKVKNATNYCIYQYDKKKKEYKEIKILGKKKRNYTINKVKKGNRFKLRAYYKPDREYSSFSKIVEGK